MAVNKTLQSPFAGKCRMCDKPCKEEVCSEGCLYGNRYNHLLLNALQSYMANCIGCNQCFYAGGALFCSVGCRTKVDKATGNLASTMQKVYCDYWNKEDPDSLLPQDSKTCPYNAKPSYQEDPNTYSSSNSLRDGRSYKAVTIGQ